MEKILKGNKIKLKIKYFVSLNEIEKEQKII